MKRYLYICMTCMLMLSLVACTGSKIDFDKCDKYITQGIDDSNLDEVLEQFDDLYEVVSSGMQTMAEHHDEPIEKVMSESEMQRFQHAQLTMVQLQAALMRASLSAESREKAYAKLLEAEKNLRDVATGTNASSSDEAPDAPY